MQTRGIRGFAEDKKGVKKPRFFDTLSGQNSKNRKSLILQEIKILIF